jgi:hypothetical protein
MSTWVGISPVIGAGSLEGFAVGATVTGAFLLAITAPRRLRRRPAAAAGTRSAPGGASSPEAEAFDAGSFGVGSFGAGAGAGAGSFDAGWFGAEAERAAQSQPGAQEDVGWTPPTRRADRAVAYRSRHRLGDPIPDGALPGAAFRDDAQPDTPFPDVALPGAASRDDAQPDTPFPDVALPDVAFPDVAFPGGVFRPSRRPAARLPRHAAPTVSFGTKVSGRVTGLFATRPLAGGAPS